MYAIFILQREMNTLQTIDQDILFWWRISTRIFLMGTGILLFLVPFLFAWPQLLVGSIVNCLLVLIALHCRHRYTSMVMIMLPSIAALMNGVIFGSFTIFLAYILPAIWIGNYLFISIIQRIQHLGLGIFVWACVKTLCIFLIVYLLFSLWLVPVIFLKTMGIIQWGTACIGGIGAMLLTRRFS